ncbi:MAG: alpha/beta hydrolase [Syntrophomonadaceae bacterium]|nr:alpha/beta hydrolase [Syntrophomonadaceae bacterium]
MPWPAADRILGAKGYKKIMELQNIRISKLNNQGIAVRAFLPAEDYHVIMVVCHGFRGTKDNGGKLFAFAQRLNLIGVGVYAFDFIGSGESDGDFGEVTLSRQADDLAWVIDFVYNCHKLPIILLGRSFGGSTVIKAGSCDERVAGFVLWSTPVKLQDTFAVMLGDAYQELEAGHELSFSDEGGIFWIGPALINDFKNHNMADYLSSIGKRPVLIVQGISDEVVDSGNAHYISSYCSNAELVLIEGADHRFSNKTIFREDITIKWLENKFLCAK